MRAARNQLLFWSLNGRSANSSVDFYCECHDQACAGKISMTIKEFRLLDATPEGFIVLAGHDRPDADNVVEKRNGYVVVDERGPREMDAERVPTTRPDAKVAPARLVGRSFRRLKWLFARPSRPSGML